MMVDTHLERHYQRQRRQQSQKVLTKTVLFGLLFVLAMRMLGTVAGVF